MLVSDFDYSLPPELIAQRPLPRRDDSRMMVVFRQEERIAHDRFKSLPRHLRREDVLVLNTARVIPAKAWGKKDGREVEFIFLREKESGTWEVLCRPARRIHPGGRVVFAPGFEGEVVGAEPRGKRLLRFSSADILGRLKEIGYAPLPPYIKRKKEESGLRKLDRKRYQTVYARREGAIAAPTAGLHFTSAVLRDIKEKGAVVCPVNLEVGQATFQPVEVDRLGDHRMLSERYTIGPKTARKIGSAKKDGRPVFAVGTTVVRTLESAWQDGRLLTGTRSTDLFIHPGYEFRVVDRLLTNFHLPRSTLLMLVSAFAGRELILRAYQEAVQQKYRFYSYGDCMLIL
ncbi:MAG: tRNA preQ1(34) S-adenosylmethionine ribosyltransferase-isomerase QueA [Candidatus Aminicenantales bacterium]